MIRDFTKEELESSENTRDTELTLGGGTLIALGGGLFLLCVICFVLGYAVGHRKSPDQASSTLLRAPDSRSSVAPVGYGSKPGAAGQAPLRPQTQAAVDVSTDASANSTQPPQVARAASDRGAGLPQPQVKPAVDSQVHPALASQNGGAQSSSSFQVQPAMTQTQGWMVQIAAVSHSEDAEVLVNALRKHGYSVMARRDVGDSLIHVQTGPFVNRNDANAMRQKLLNDGYNAIVQ
jgi:DedD protein